jgi:ESS family glutamate:Na+ symporter
LLILGKLLRIYIPFLQRIYLPASVIGGLVGLVLLQSFGHALPADWSAGWGKIPGFLINIVFAGLFLGTAAGAAGQGIWRKVSEQLCFGQIVAWGQYVVGLGLAILVLTPLFGTPGVFGNLLEICFEGGHGTVGGLAPTFLEFGWEAGPDLGYTMATCGMILGVVLGMVMVNIAARRGDIKNIRNYEDLDDMERKGIYPLRHEQPLAGRQTVYPDSIDSLALHVALIGVAMLIGYGLKVALVGMESWMPAAVQNTHVLKSLPLFPLCMIGGLFLQLFFRALKIEYIVSPIQMQRLAGTALDFLVVSAIATIRIEFVLAWWLPLLLLIVVGTLWSFFCVWWLGPRMFKEAWFERAIAEFGMAMGVTATGLLLLRTVDPENKTVAAQAFGYKQLIHEPFMGGGLWTSLAFVLVMTQGAGVVWWISAAALVFWLGFWRFGLKRGAAAANPAN